MLRSRLTLNSCSSSRTSSSSFVRHISSRLYWFLPSFRISLWISCFFPNLAFATSNPLRQLKFLHDAKWHPNPSTLPALPPQAHHRILFLKCLPSPCQNFHNTVVTG